MRPWPCLPVLKGYSTITKSVATGYGDYWIHFYRLIKSSSGLNDDEGKMIQKQNGILPIIIRSCCFSLFTSVLVVFFVPATLRILA